MRVPTYLPVNVDTDGTPIVVPRHSETYYRIGALWLKVRLWLFNASLKYR